MKRSVNQVQNM